MITNNKTFTKRIYIFFCYTLFNLFFLSNSGISHIITPKKGRVYPVVTHFMLYDCLGPGSDGLSKVAYTEAVKGFDSLQSTGMLLNKTVLSIVDFSLPSFKKRLFVIDIATGKLLFNTFVSHGRNSGREFATKFSNHFHSFQSSLGFYVTGQTYIGCHGYSLRLQGIEQGINNNAFSRGIVMHAARYVNENSAEKRGFIGRSEGCPAIPVNMHRAIIEVIKNGTCLFIYGTDKKYLVQSKYLQRNHEA